MNIYKKLLAFLMIVALLVMAPAALATQGDSEELDLTKLQELLEIAVVAEEENFTAESWQALQLAIEGAYAAMENGNQLQVDAAASQLAKALSELRLDYSELESVIAEAEQYLLQGGPEWEELYRAIVEAQAVYGSGSQASVNMATDKIRDCLQRLKDPAGGENQESGSQGNQGGQTTVEQVVRYERESATVWIILLCVSLAVNAAVVVRAIWNRKNNRKRQIDDVPLVDYDIDDDVV